MSFVTSEQLAIKLEIIGSVPSVDSQDAGPRCKFEFDAPVIDSGVTDPLTAFPRKIFRNVAMIFFFFLLRFRFRNSNSEPLLTSILGLNI